MNTPLFADRLRDPLGQAKMAAAVAGLFGFTLILIALPRLSGAVAQVPAGSALWGLEEGVDVTPFEFAQAQEAALEATFRDPGNGSYHDDLGALLLASASVEPKGSEVWEDRLIRAGLSFRAAAEHTPLNAAVWGRYAYALSLRDGFSPLVAHALEMSYLAGRLDFRVLPLRLSLSLRNWDALSDELRADATWQLRTAWKYQAAHSALFILYVNLGFAERVILRDALSEDAEVLATFDKQLKVWLRWHAPTDLRSRYLS